MTTLPDCEDCAQHLAQNNLFLPKLVHLPPKKKYRSVYERGFEFPRSEPCFRGRPYFLFWTLFHWAARNNSFFYKFSQKRETTITIQGSVTLYALSMSIGKLLCKHCKLGIRYAAKRIMFVYTKPALVQCSICLVRSAANRLNSSKNNAIWKRTFSTIGILRWVASLKRSRISATYQS